MTIKKKVAVRVSCETGDALATVESFESMTETLSRLVTGLEPTRIVSSSGSAGVVFVIPERKVSDFVEFLATWSILDVEVVQG